MQEEKKGITWFVLLSLVFGVLILFCDWAYQMEIIPFTGSLSVVGGIIDTINVGNKIFFVRGSLIVLLGAIVFLSRRGKTKEKKPVILISAPLLSVLFILGYTDYYYYALYLYPVIFLGSIITIPIFLRYFIENGLSNEKPIGITTESIKDISVSIKTQDEGELVINDPRQGIFIEGAAKSGKSVLIIQLIQNFIKNGYAGVIYDYEGDLTEEEGGLLTKVAYHSILKHNTNVKFAFINFTDLRRTVRCNPVSKKYIRDYNDCQSLALTLMLNLNKDWTVKTDFWAQNAFSVVAATIYYFNRNLPEAMCTLPHMIDFLLNDFEIAIKILATDPEVAFYINPVLGPIKKGAGGQIAGVQSSVQLYLAKLRSPEIYYVLSPPEHEEFDLNITNKENPYIFCLGNAPKKPGVYDAALGVIVQILKGQMNQLGKNKSIWLFDELPTIFIDKLDKIPAEARKKGVCTILSVQTMKQLQDGYSKGKAGIIYDNCGSVFVGRTTTESADRMVKTFGEYKKEDKTDSFNEGSYSYSVKEHFDKVIRTSDITNQGPGHFTGMITGGKPPLFSTQLHFAPPKTAEIPNFNLALSGDDEEINTIVKARALDIANEVLEFIGTKVDEFDLYGKNVKVVKAAKT